MAKALSYKEGIGRKDLLAVRRRFIGIHRERLKRIAAELTIHQRPFVELLPLLIHINHPMLPGFVSTDAPAGIPDYSPTQAIIRSARKLGRSFEYKKRARRQFAIQGLYLMGSIGSIGHSSGSDFDVWLCYNPDLTSSELDQLRVKTQKIEEWAKELYLEVHFFLMDVEEFRQGKHDSISHESSGSTQPHLLLEEFYRSGVLLAGRYPIWWLVPPEEESNYDDFVAMLFRQRFVNPADCIDFGNLESLPPEEFLGAAHWQLFKGIESPYKTILKLLLTEAYSEDYPKVRWLCQEAKQHIFEGDFDMDSLDPYMLMYRRVESYLTARNEVKRLNVARRCFYIKTGLALSKEKRRTRNSWKKDLLTDLVNQWQWDRVTLATLDSRLSWKIDQVMDERNTLVRELTHSYRLLTDFAREFASSNMVDPRELSLLGRKLYTAMEKRPGKIDRINPGISRSLIEPRVSIHLANTRGEGLAWFLFLGNIEEREARVTSPLKTAQSLIELLAWCHLNQVIDHNSNIILYPKNNTVRSEELYALISTLYNRYPIHETLEVPMEQLASPHYALSCSLFLNTGHDPMAHLAKQGKQLTSNRCDPLSFGAAHISLVKSVDQLVTTSWGETLVITHSGAAGLLDSLCHYLRLTILVNPETQPDPVSA
ncbi:MAG: class I adenylate cyclase, partial [Gammaproteobacteria bacterium]|nr:class I adenylate cyclase [Gammaproteobacteria bacterium]